MISVIARLLQEQPIVVTGMGCYSAAGDSVERLWQCAVAARGLAEWRDFGKDDETARFAVCTAPAVDVSSPELRAVRKLDRSAQMAWLAAKQAWDQARLKPTPNPSGSE